MSDLLRCVGKPADKHAEAKRMYQKQMSATHFDQEDQKKVAGSVLGGVQVNSHGTKHPFIARIPDGDSEAAPQSQRTNAERNKDRVRKLQRRPKVRG